ncbi:MAG: DUF5777 family beta-barrel protein [Candidatus Margulisiibacteriota bacterium]|nr:DUF5777 family beta-barrel protein [Candidatus Margulisiibacteriota bacterium]
MSIYNRFYHIIIIFLLLISNILNKSAIAASDYYSYCNTFGITCPQQLDEKLINTNIAHRFYGPISDGTDTFWGLDNGANVMLYLSTTLTKVDKIHIQRISVDKDIQIGYQRSTQVLALPLFVMAQVNANWYNDNNSDVFNGFSVVGVSWDYKIGQLHTNIGYDHYEEDLGAGAAIVLSINSDWDMVLEGYTTSQSNDNALSVGIVYHTFGHRFKVGIHNSANIGFRQLMQGTTNKDWVLGFQIHRLLEW